MTAKTTNKVSFDGIIHVGPASIAALVSRTIDRRFLRLIPRFAAKRPVAILIRCDGVTLTFDPDGSRIDLNDFERRFPGKRAEFERRVARETDEPMPRPSIDPVVIGAGAGVTE